MAKRAARNPRLIGVIQAGVFLSVKSHQPNQRMQSGIVTKVIPNTLMELPMKVASEACMPNEGRIGLRKRISSITMSLDVTYAAGNDTVDSLHVWQKVRKCLDKQAISHKQVKQMRKTIYNLGSR
jgi:hypothetical protein